MSDAIPHHMLRVRSDQLCTVMTHVTHMSSRCPYCIWAKPPHMMETPCPSTWPAIPRKRLTKAEEAWIPSLLASRASLRLVASHDSRRCSLVIGAMSHALREQHAAAPHSPQECSTCVTVRPATPQTATLPECWQTGFKPLTNRADMRAARCGL